MIYASTQVGNKIIWTWHAHCWCLGQFKCVFSMNSEMEDIG